MNSGELLLGIGLLAASALALWVAMPREGQVRPFLRSDTVQAYFTVFVLAAFALGIVNIVTGLVR